MSTSMPVSLKKIHLGPTSFRINSCLMCIQRRAMLFRVSVTDRQTDTYIQIKNNPTTKLMRVLPVKKSPAKS